jgi:hypothetical protein
MSFFTSGYFWFLEGILLCLVVLGVRAWAEGRGLPVPVWQWALIVIWLIYCGFTLAFVGTCLGEKEQHAALLGGTFFGLIAVIGGVGLYRLLNLARHCKKETDEDG